MPAPGLTPFETQLLATLKETNQLLAALGTQVKFLDSTIANIDFSLDLDGSGALEIKIVNDEPIRVEMPKVTI